MHQALNTLFEFLVVLRTHLSQHGDQMLVEFALPFLPQLLQIIFMVLVLKMMVMSMRGMTMSAMMRIRMMLMLMR